MMGSKLKKKSALIILIIVQIVMCNISPSIACDNKIKNVILMIPDGTSISHVTLSRWYNGGKNFAMDEIVTGLTRTYWKDGIITDSAAAATAFSTGNKTVSGNVAVVPYKDEQNNLSYVKPVATIIEAAQKLGKSTGIVCTSNLNDATPAGFSSHVKHRMCWDSISEQQVYSNIDVFLGGGSAWYFSGDQKYNRKDGRILKDEIINNGYHFVTNKKDMQEACQKKLWGAFAPVDMPWDMFMDKDIVPTIKDMTKKSLEILSQNDNGFFLLVEGSKIDWASHYSDTIGIISEVLAFDEAVKEVLNFAKSREDTVVIISPDHGNGGLSIGGETTDNTYEFEKLEAFINPLKKIDMPPKELPKLLNEDMSNLREILSCHCGINDLTKEEEDKIKKSRGRFIETEINRAIAKRANLSYTTVGHTGEDVFLACYHPKNQVLHGVVENIDINKYIANLIGVDLDKLSDQLFVEAKTAFSNKGYRVLVSDKLVKELVVTNGKDTLRLPYNKNIAYLNDREIKLDGINVYTGEYLFVTENTIKILDNLKKN